MKLRTRFPSVPGKATLATAVLGGVLLFLAVPGAKANDWDKCNRRISYAEWRYQEAVEHSGPQSGAARHWYHERQEAYERAEHLRKEWREHHQDRGNWDRR